MPLRRRGSRSVQALPLNSIIVRDGRAVGVRLETGEEIEAEIVVSNADPKTTFTKLIDACSLPAGFQGFGEKVQGLSTRSASLKLHAALSRLPDFSKYLRPGDAETWSPWSASCLRPTISKRVGATR